MLFFSGHRSGPLPSPETHFSGAIALRQLARSEFISGRDSFCLKIQELFCMTQDKRTLSRKDFRDYEINSGFPRVTSLARAGYALSLAFIEAPHSTIPAAIRFLAPALVSSRDEPFQERLGGRMAPKSQMRSLRGPWSRRITCTWRAKETIGCVALFPACRSA